MLPLNGTKTRPLSEHARAVLKDVAQSPAPRSSLNPGVVNRLLRESLVEEVSLPSPFKAHKGAAVDHLQITSAGRAAIAGEQSEALSAATARAA